MYLWIGGVNSLAITTSLPSTCHGRPAFTEAARPWPSQASWPADIILRAGSSRRFFQAATSAGVGSAGISLSG